MNVHPVLSEYINRAISQAEFDKLEDGTFAGRIPVCKGVIAFAGTLFQCQTELRSTLEDWLLVAFKLGHELTVIDEIDSSKELAFRE